jgi:hypothetical protein
MDHLQRLIDFLARLAAVGMSQEALAVRGYDFALTWLLFGAEFSLKKGEEVPNGRKLELMERAAELTVQATGLLEVNRHSLAGLKREQDERQ